MQSLALFYCLMKRTFNEDKYKRFKTGVKMGVKHIFRHLVVRTGLACLSKIRMYFSHLENIYE